VLEEKSLNLPSHRTVEEAEVVRAATIKENNILNETEHKFYNLSPKKTQWMV